MSSPVEEVDLSSLRIQKEPESPESPPTRKRFALILASAGFVAVAIIIVVLYGVLNPRPPVRVATVSLVYPSQADAILTASGYVVAQRQASIASKATGRLVFLGVEEGDRVKEGQVVARIESEDVEAALAQAVANYELAKATLEQAKAGLHEASLTFDRQKTLLEAELISQAEFDAAEARLKSSVAAVDAAEANVRATDAAVNAAEVGVDNTRIRSPFDGTVLAKNADVGEVVAPFAAGSNTRGAVVTVADMTSLEVEADVSESNIERIRVGMLCEIILDAYPQIRYRGVVHKIVPTADRAKATVLTKVRFVDRDERVLPEMSAKVHFLSRASHEDSASSSKVAISPTAIIDRGGTKVVFLVEAGSVVETPVDVGGQLGSLVEIRSGLTPGDQIVLNPPDDLEDGTRIQVVR